MKIAVNNPPRCYTVGGVTISDCARVSLLPDEQITLTTVDGAEVDVTRKEWGFYAAPSLNGRLARFGLRSALTANGMGKLFVMLVEAGKEAVFEKYLAEQDARILCWLDTDDAARALIERLTP